MKTRIYCLPLVILALLFFGNDIFAQSTARSPLFVYLQKMPESPTFPDNAALKSTPPVKFEEHEDLNAMEAQIQNIDNNSKNAQINTAVQNPMQDAPANSEVMRTDDNTQAKRAGDLILATLKDIQLLKIEFEQNFKRLEVIYNKNLDKVNEVSRIAQKEHPCAGNTDCLHEHARQLNNGIIAATREKTVNEQYLLSVYLARVKPGFKSLDDMLSRNSYGEGIHDTKVRDSFQNARHDEMLFLTDYIERIKLERITISNCARLAQQ